MSDDVEYLAIGAVRLESYLTFAHGGFSDVYEGVYTGKTGGPRKVAVKVLRGIHNLKTEDRQKFNRRLRSENEVWRVLDHPNVLPFLGVCYDPTISASPALISPLCWKGSAVDYLKQHKDKDRLEMLLGVALGLQYLHLKNVIHGDLKATNILVDEKGTPLLCDFGRSRILEQRGFTTTLIGTQRYMAPELFSQYDEEKMTSYLLTKASDVYAFAMVGLEILSGESPFYRMQNQLALPLKIMSGKRPEWKHHPLPQSCTNAKGLIEKCWHLSPKRRPHVDQVVADLKNLRSTGGSRHKTGLRRLLSWGGKSG